MSIPNKLNRYTVLRTRARFFLSRALLGKVLFAGAVAFLGLLVVEGSLEYYGVLQELRMDAAQAHRPFYWWSFHTYSGTRLKEHFPGAPHEGILKLQLTPAMGYKNMPNQKTAYFSIDGSGLRGSRSPNNAASRVVLLGGSTAFGTGLDSDAQTFAHQIEVVLPKTRVLNAGVIGYESGQELVYLVTELIDQRPALVITLDGVNDFAESYQPSFDRMTHGFANFNVIDDQIAAAEKQFSRPLIEKLLSLHKFLFISLEERMKLGAAAISFPLRQGKIGENIVIAARNYAANIHKMSGIAHYGGARFLCVIQPFRALNNRDDERFGKGYRKFIGIAGRELHRQKVAIMNLNSTKYNKYLKPSFFMDEVHLDYRGNVAMARLVAERIRKLRLLGWFRETQLNNGPENGGRSRGRSRRRRSR